MNSPAIFALTALLTATGLTSSLAAPVAAPAAANLPDRAGDYYRNETPIKGKAPRPLMPGSLWRVVSPKLNCRRSPGDNQPIVRQFQRGEHLQAEVYRGGADEVLLNAKDANGKPWMPVRGNAPADVCYVRAHDRAIHPVTQPLK